MIKSIIMLLLATALALPVVAAVPPSRNGIVSHVIDGDTFMLTSGETVRLLGVNTPELGRKGRPDQFFAAEARDFLRHTLEGKEVTLCFVAGKSKDKYGRLLAFVTQEDTVINQRLIREGFGHLYTFPDTVYDTTELQQLSAQARAAKSGIWQQRRVWSATADIPDMVIGSFQLVSGQVKTVNRVRDVIYLNFGYDWRRDFSVAIPRKYWQNFPFAPDAFQDVYQGQQVLVRGKLKPVNGVLVTVSHPSQLESIKN